MNPSQDLCNRASHGRQIDEPATNFALGFIDSMAPRDATDAPLLAQMAATLTASGSTAAEATTPRRHVGFWQNSTASLDLNCCR